MRPTRCRYRASPGCTATEVEHTSDGGLVIRLYVDRWEWLIPLVMSYGGDVLRAEPAALRDAVITHLRQALDAYKTAATIGLEPAAAGFRNDDSRLRSTRSRALAE